MRLFNKSIILICLVSLVLVILLSAANSENLKDEDTYNLNRKIINTLIDTHDYLSKEIDSVGEALHKLKIKEDNYRPHIEGLVLDEELLDYIWKKSCEEDISYTLILAIIGVESNYGEATVNVNTNGTVDSGIAQINSENTGWLAELAGIEKVDVQNDYHNVDMMIELLKYERDYFREVGYSEEDVFILTVIAYNRGRGNTIEHIKKHGVKENNYARKVIAEKERLESKI